MAVTNSSLPDEPDETLIIMRHICENKRELRLDYSGYAICYPEGGVIISGHDIDFLLDDYKTYHMP